MNEIHPQYVIDAQGRPHSVLLSLDEFEDLLECAEDVLDAQEMERLKSEPRVSWEEVKAEREG